MDGIGRLKVTWWGQLEKSRKFEIGSVKKIDKKRVYYSVKKWKEIVTYTLVCSYALRRDVSTGYPRSTSRWLAPACCMTTGIFRMLYCERFKLNGMEKKDHIKGVASKKKKILY